MKDWLKIGFGFGLLWLGVLRGAKAVQVRMQSYSFRNISTASGTVGLNLNLAITNPLLVGVKISRVAGDVYAQGIKIGDTNKTYDYYLSGRHTHILPVEITLDMKQTTQAAILNIQSGDVRTLTIGFDGKLYVGNIAIPVRFEMDYNDLMK